MKGKKSSYLRKYKIIKLVTLYSLLYLVFFSKDFWTYYRYPINSFKGIMETCNSEIYFISCS